MNALDEDWKILVSMLPPSWQRTARLSGALERLRGFDSVDELLRVLLMHVGCGYSLRETAVRAKAAGLAEVSDVTLLNRLRQAETGGITSVRPCWRKVECTGKGRNRGGACALWTGP